MSRLPTFGQFWCFKGVHEQGIVVMVFLAMVWWRRSGGKGPGSDYVRLLHLPSEFCYISRQREGGRESGEGRDYWERKTKCFTDCHGDVLRWTQRGDPVLLSAGQVSSGALTAQSYAVSYCSVFIVVHIQREIQQRYGVFQAWNCWFPCVFSYFQILWHNISQFSNVFNLQVLFTHVTVEGKCSAHKVHINHWWTCGHVNLIHLDSANQLRSEPRTKKNKNKCKENQTLSAGSCMELHKSSLSDSGYLWKIEVPKKHKTTKHIIHLMWNVLHPCVFEHCHSLLKQGRKAVQLLVNVTF